MKDFYIVLTKLIQLKKETDFTVLFPLLPDDIQKNIKQFDEMFSNLEKHSFYVLCSLLSDWARELIDRDNGNELLDNDVVDAMEELVEIFEFVSDDMSFKEQEKVIIQVERLLTVML